MPPACTPLPANGRLSDAHRIICIIMNPSSLNLRGCGAVLMSSDDDRRERKKNRNWDQPPPGVGFDVNAANMGGMPPNMGGMPGMMGGMPPMGMPGMGMNPMQQVMRAVSVARAGRLLHSSCAHTFFDVAVVATPLRS